MLDDQCNTILSVYIVRAFTLHNRLRGAGIRARRPNIKKSTNEFIGYDNIAYSWRSSTRVSQEKWTFCRQLCNWKTSFWCWKRYGVVRNCWRKTNNTLCKSWQNVSTNRDNLFAPLIVPFVHQDNLTLKQDNAMLHVKRMCSNFLQSNNVDVLLWPAFLTD